MKKQISIYPVKFRRNYFAGIFPASLTFNFMNFKLYKLSTLLYFTTLLVVTLWVITLQTFNCCAQPGSLDPSFSSDGIQTTPIGSGSADVGRSVAIQPDGKIVVAGYFNGTADFPAFRRGLAFGGDPGRRNNQSYFEETSLSLKIIK